LFEALVPDGSVLTAATMKITKATASMGESNIFLFMKRIFEPMILVQAEIDGKTVI